MRSLPIRIRWNSIYRKLLVTYLVLTALGTSILAGYILWSFYGYFMRMRQNDLDNWTSAMSESVADALEDNDLQRVKLLVQRYGAPQSVTLRIFTPDGRLLFTSDPQDRQISDWSNLNVLDNAIKHSVPDSMVFVSGKIEAFQVAVQIQDQGPGIEESDLPHIFEQFYTADPSRKGSGTGLGLAIARRIVETHGGSITASNTATGKGATFTICLPINTGLVFI